MEKIKFNVSPYALGRISVLGAFEGNKILKVAIRGGGCAGLEYKLHFVDHPSPIDQIFEFNFDGKSVSLITDQQSAQYLNGVILDYDDSVNGKGFEFINPNATRSCGCGVSFGV